VEFEKTNFLRRGKKCVRIPVPNGDHMFKSFEQNHSYDECHVFVSIAKRKNTSLPASRHALFTMTARRRTSLG